MLILSNQTISKAEDIKVGCLVYNQKGTDCVNNRPLEKRVYLMYPDWKERALSNEVLLGVS